MLKDPKRRFVVVILIIVLGVKSWEKREQKMFANKNFSKWNKKICMLTKNEVHKRPMRAKCYLLWHIMVLNCLVWPCVALCGLVWPCVALCGLVWHCVALCGLMWPFVALSSPDWYIHTKWDFLCHFLPFVNFCRLVSPHDLVYWQILLFMAFLAYCNFVRLFEVLYKYFLNYFES